MRCRGTDREDAFKIEGRGGRRTADPPTDHLSHLPSESAIGSRGVKAHKRHKGIGPRDVSYLIIYEGFAKYHRLTYEIFSDKFIRTSRIIALIKYQINTTQNRTGSSFYLVACGNLRSYFLGPKRLFGSVKRSSQSPGC